MAEKVVASLGNQATFSGDVAQPLAWVEENEGAGCIW